MPVTLTNQDTADHLLIEISESQYYSMARCANEISPLYLRLKNSIKTENGNILVPCNATDAEMLLGVAKHFCPDAVSKIEFVISMQNNAAKANQASLGDANVETMPVKQLGRRDRYVTTTLSKIVKAKNLLIKGLRKYSH